MLVFDAEQLSFKKFDDNEVIWRTINGNRVPIPKHGSRAEKAKAIKEWFANKKTRSYWGASTNNRYREATKILSKHGLSGIAYTGHGTSRVSGFKDGEGNVTFNPERDIEVLERTTDPEVIKQWITRQKKINNGGKNA